MKVIARTGERYRENWPKVWGEVEKIMGRTNGRKNLLSKDEVLGSLLLHLSESLLMEAA